MTHNRFRQFHFCLLFLKAYMLFKNNQPEPIYVQCIYCTYVQRKPETGLYNRNLTALKAWHNYHSERESQGDFICYIYFPHVNILKPNKNKLLMHSLTQFIQCAFHSLLLLLLIIIISYILVCSKALEMAIWTAVFSAAEDFICCS